MQRHQSTGTSASAACRVSYRTFYGEPLTGVLMGRRPLAWPGGNGRLLGWGGERGYGQRMRPIRAVLIDIDGVLTVSWKPLPGAVAALGRLRAAGVPLALVTNTTSRTRASIADTLAEASFPVTAGDIAFGSVRVDGVTYDHDLIIDRGKVRKRKKAPSRKFRGTYGHTPLSAEEDIPWRCRRLVIGTGAEGALPVLQQVRDEARRRKIDLIIAVLRRGRVLPDLCPGWHPGALTRRARPPPHRPRRVTHPGVHPPAV